MAMLVAPRTTLIGGGCVGEIASLLARLGLSRPLIVTDPVMVSTGLIERVLAPLRAAGIVAAVFAHTIPEPEDHVVDAGLAVMRAGDFDCLVAFGGGSPIDTAKAMTILASGGTHLRAWKMPVAADFAKLPLIAIPTTAGTGSEATRAAVVTDTVAQEKMLIMGLGAVPLAAIVDFELTLSVPKRTTADTGLDTLTHALEAYVSRKANPYSDAMALAALDLIGGALPRVYADGQDRGAREAMMMAAHLAGIAFTNASVALVHGMSRPVGAHFHVPHGLSNAMLLCAVTRFSLAGAPGRYATAARHLGFAVAADGDAVAGEKLVAGLARLVAALDVPGPAAFGISYEDWHGRVAVMAAQAVASGSPANNPRVADVGEIAGLYGEVWVG